MLEEGTLVFLRSANRKDSFLVSLESEGKLETRLGLVFHKEVMKAGFGGRVCSHNGNVFTS